MAHGEHHDGDDGDDEEEDRANDVYVRDYVL